VALRSKSEYWLAGNYDNVSEWSDVSKYGLLFQSVSTITILWFLVWPERRSNPRGEHANHYTTKVVFWRYTSWLLQILPSYKFLFNILSFFYQFVLTLVLLLFKKMKGLINIWRVNLSLPSFLTSQPIPSLISNQSTYPFPHF
jgi:hypothetical protein